MRTEIKFVIPITTVIETGNHIAKIKTGNRRAAAKRFSKLMSDVANRTAPFLLIEVEWNEDFLQRFLQGDSTGSPFVDLAGAGRFGGGDVSILVERDVLRSRSALHDVKIWTLEQEMTAYS